MKKPAWKRIVRPLYEWGKGNTKRAYVMFSFLQFLNNLVNFCYMKKSAKEEGIRKPDAYRKSLVVVSIAFNKVSLIEKQIRMVNQHASPEVVFVIADNSSDRASRMKINELARKYSVPYIGLPPNPWSQANLSHSVALNWVYRNLIKRIRPFAFGFIDHDLFPTKPIDVLEILDDEVEMYGLMQPRENKYKKAWYLWAGFCFYKYDYVKDIKLDFSSVVISNPAYYLELDTGGGNYKKLYSDIHPQQVRFAREEYLSDGGAMIDSWFHLQKASFKNMGTLNSQLLSLEQ